MLLTSTSDIVRIVTSSAADIHVQAGWADITTTTFTPGRTNTAIATATTTTIIGSPAASTQRQVKTLSIFNTHASTSNTITIQHYDGTTSVDVYEVTLAAGERAQYNGGEWPSTATATGAGVTDGDKGDITVSASGATWTIDNSTVTLAKQADVATSTVFYRKTAGTGAPEVNTLATLKTDLGLTGTNSGDQTSIVGITGTKAEFDTAVTDGNILYVGDITQYTDELAQDAVGGMVDASLTYVDGTPLLQRAALTGDVTALAGSNATTIANDAVTYAKMQNVSATDKLLGRSTLGAGDVEEITCTAAGRALLDDADAAAQRTTLGLGTLATQSGTFSGTSSGTNTGDQTGTLKSFQILTTGTGATYTKPADVTSILVEVIGGGGGGGGAAGAASSFAAAGGGGGGGYARLWIASASSTYTYTIGAAGVAGTAGFNAGGNGGTTTFSASGLQATGGTGGGGASSGTSASAGVFFSGGAGGVGTNGDVNSSGFPGDKGIASLGALASGFGGGSFLGGGAVSVANTTGAGVGATTRGTGGSGGSSTTTSFAGGAGAAGLIIVWEFS